MTCAYSTIYDDFQRPKQSGTDHWTWNFSEIRISSPSGIPRSAALTPTSQHPKQPAVCPFGPKVSNPFQVLDEFEKEHARERAVQSGYSILYSALPLIFVFWH